MYSEGVAVFGMVCSFIILRHGKRRYKPLPPIGVHAVYLTFHFTGIILVYKKYSFILSRQKHGYDRKLLFLIVTFDNHGKSHGRDRMVAGFTFICVISAYHHQSCESM